MGKRLHVASRYVVEWGKVENFNWKTEEFHSVLSALDVADCPVESDECDGGQFSDNFEVPIDDMYSALESLQNINLIDEEQLDDIKTALKNLYAENIEGDGIQQFWTDMKKYIQEADTSDGYLHFSFF